MHRVLPAISRVSSLRLDSSSNDTEKSKAAKEQQNVRRNSQNPDNKGIDYDPYPYEKMAHLFFLAGVKS